MTHREELYPIVEFITIKDDNGENADFELKTSHLPEPYLYYLQQAYFQTLEKMITGKKDFNQEDSDKIHELYSAEFRRVFND